ncbi:UbiA family prenyltransferase [Actinomadura fulvescens]|uniref:4-hydroxybenzoate polyprenyltransferase n=1 Tax=Actinomadura fulvescens TaxID=46160 RepID=A0ABP6CV97_9ACTN
MITRLRLMILLARPAVVVIVAMFAAVGLAQAGHDGGHLDVVRILLVVLGFVLFSVACNDLADEAIDRVNLPGDRRRPLVTGAADRRQMIAVALVCATVALAAAATIGTPAVAVTCAGLTVSAGYSLRPVRLADRGAVASLVLPACYVAVPYLLGVLAVSSSVRTEDLLLLTGLYVGFIGRILLKDFRDVRGDALFGKRTFLVRHGRAWTCAISAACWVAGTLLALAAVRQPTPALAAANVAGVAGTLWLLRALVRPATPRQEEALISATAIIGRGLVLVLLAHLSLLNAHWSTSGYHAVMAALAFMVASQAISMVRHGPPTRRLPDVRRQHSTRAAD